MKQYTFGDSDLARHRLKVLADVYADSTKSFIIESIQEKPRLFIDLGCGPGHTTHLIADALSCDRALGLDSSERFISSAQKSATDRVSFQLHDVTKIPFPAAAADLLYCRFLMTHLRDPQAVILNWATQLKCGGFIMMEETEDIWTSNETFAFYLEIVEAMIRAQDGNLYVGRLLEQMRTPEVLTKVKSEVKRLAVSTREAALMFFLNILTWRQQPFIFETYPCSLIDELEQSLKQLSEQAGNETDIEWHLRQMVFERS